MADMNDLKIELHLATGPAYEQVLQRLRNEEMLHAKRIEWDARFETKQEIERREAEKERTIRESWYEIEVLLRQMARVRLGGFPGPDAIKDMEDTFRMHVLPDGWELILLGNRNKNSCQYVIGPREE